MAEDRKRTENERHIVSLNTGIKLTFVVREALETWVEEPVEATPP